MYICQLSLLQLLLWGIFICFKDRLLEAICGCLQTCYVDVMLLLKDCMCIPTFIAVTPLVA